MTDDLELDLELTPEDQAGLRQSRRMEMSFEDYLDFLEEMAALKPVHRPEPKSYPELFRL
jgi:hypothetical protein